MWIESDQLIARDPRTARLARAAGISLAQAIGHLHLLWWWALDFALETGELSAYRPEDIAAAALWHDDPATWLAALVDSEWLLTTPAGLILADWQARVGRLLDKRSRDRAAAARRPGRSTTPTESAPSQRRVSAGPPPSRQGPNRNRTGPDRNAIAPKTDAAAPAAKLPQPISGGTAFDDLETLRDQVDLETWERLTTRFGVEPVQQARRRAVYRQRTSTDWPYIAGILRSWARLGIASQPWASEADLDPHAVPPGPAEPTTPPAALSLEIPPAAPPAPDPAAQLWTAILAEIAQQVSKPNLAPLRQATAVTLDHHVLLIAAPDAQTRDWINARLGSLLHKTATAIAGRQIDVPCIVDDQEDHQPCR